MMDLPFTPVPKAELKDPDYLEFCRDQCRVRKARCVVTGLWDRTVVPHHVRPKAIWGDKNNIVYMSSPYHVERKDSAHALGHHAVFDAEHGTDLVGTAIKQYQDYLREHENA